VAHACNPSYSGESQLKACLAIAGGVSQGVGPE
jgi:hypothetical protein